MRLLSPLFMLLEGLLGVSEASLWGLNQLEQAHIMGPRNLCNKLLHNYLIQSRLVDGKLPRS